MMPENDIRITSSFLKEGKVVCFPTETVYGIGVIFDDENAYRELCQIKRRPPEKPFSVMFSGLEEAMKHLIADRKTEKTLRRFLPGEITFLVHSRPDLPFQATLGTGIVGVRIPADKAISELLRETGKPCLVTSANRSGEKPLVKYEEVEKEFADDVAFIAKGECVSCTPTTIVDLTDPSGIKLIREGSIPFADIEAYWRKLQ